MQPGGNAGRLRGATVCTPATFAPVLMPIPYLPSLQLFPLPLYFLLALVCSAPTLPSDELLSHLLGQV